jgi:YgiT-type zinc finger domain-containing protein
MKSDRCSFCGGERFEERRTEYLYSHDGKYLLVPDAPVLVCATCGMIYYEAAVLKEIERRFFAIQREQELPDRYIEMPETAYR